MKGHVPIISHLEIPQPQACISFPPFQSRGYGSHIDSSALAELLSLELGIDLLMFFVRIVLLMCLLVTRWWYKCPTVQSQHHPSNLDFWLICLLCPLRVSLRPCLARFRRIDQYTRSGRNHFFSPLKDVWLVTDTSVLRRLEDATTTTSQWILILLRIACSCAML